MRRIFLGLGLLVWIGGAAWAQSAADRLRFAAASVKPAEDYDFSVRGGQDTTDPGRFTATGANLATLLALAHGLSNGDQLSGPAWLETEPYDVVATVPPGATRDQFQQMLRNLLEERFQMQVHHETQAVPVYELVVAENGPKLQPAGAGPGTGVHFSRGEWRQTFRMWSMSSLASTLGSPAAAGRRVIDKTGLTGQYDFSLYFRPSNMKPGPDDDAPSVEQAVQEQLGLKLVPSKAPIDVVVVDRAEKTPTEN